MFLFRYKKFQEFDSCPDKIDMKLLLVNPSLRYQFIRELNYWLFQNSSPFNGQRLIIMNPIFSNSKAVVIERTNDGKRETYSDKAFFSDGAEFDFIFARTITCGQFKRVNVKSVDVDTGFILACVLGSLVNEQNEFPLQVTWVRSKEKILDVNVLFRKLYEMAVPNNEMSFKHFLYCFDFLYVTFSF